MYKQTTTQAAQSQLKAQSTTQTQPQSAMQSKQACIFNIQRYTIHDGPGIRTEIFMKGCPLSCPWCSNPEGFKPHPEPGLYPSRCLGRKVCGLCERAAKLTGQTDLVRFDDEGKICAVCKDPKADWMSAVKACPSGALKVWGEFLDLDEVLDIIRRDLRFYETSGGGVTISGGEPLQQAPFVKDLLCRCQQEGIHTCLETTLHAPWEVLESLLPFTDLLIADFKCASAEKHKEVIGVSNELIKQNFVRVSRKISHFIVRIPIVPNFNDSADDLREMLEFSEQDLDGRVRDIELLEYMRLGQEKCHSLQRAYPMEDFDFNRSKLHKQVLAIQEEFCRRGFNCVVGNVEKRKAEKQ